MDLNIKKEVGFEFQKLKNVYLREFSYEKIGKLEKNET